MTENVLKNFMFKQSWQEQLIASVVFISSLNLWTLWCFHLNLTFTSTQQQSFQAWTQSLFDEYFKCVVKSLSIMRSRLQHLLHHLTCWSFMSTQLQILWAWILFFFDEHLEHSHVDVSSIFHIYTTAVSSRLNFVFIWWILWTQSCLDSIMLKFR